MLRRLRIENLVLIREAELELSPGLNAITGETGTGKTILAQAVGLLLGAKGDAKAIGPGAGEAYVEAEFDVPDGFYEEEEGLEALAELRPESEPGLVIARRIFGDGRTRAYAWGRAAAREDVAAAAELLVGMSGQFEQRRLARPAYQLDVLDSFAGDEQLRRRAALRVGWRALAAARRRRDELVGDAKAAEARLAELQALVQDMEGLEADTEELLLAERERLRHVTELAECAVTAAEALAPEDGDGAAELAAQAERAIAPLERIAPELGHAGGELREAGVRLRETAAELRSFLAGLEAEPGRLEHVEGELDRIAVAKRRFGYDSYGELFAGAGEARAELKALEGGADPAAEAEAELAAAQAAVDELAAELRKARRAAAKPFAKAVAGELQGIGLGEGEFHVELGETGLGITGIDTAAFLARPNAGLPFGPIAETASGGELSRIALAIAAAAGGKMTLVFDEIDAGIGGRTAHAVAQMLRRLGERSQVVTITHLPQIASVADRHFSVEKVPGDPTYTRIEALDEGARREELERMLGGREFLSTVR
jgi:DNA repair protein RecN (Recombination protein N)